MSVEELEKAVSELPPDKFARFRDWFEAFAADEWDKQIALDAKSGKLDKLFTDSEMDFQQGRMREL